MSRATVPAEVQPPRWGWLFDCLGPFFATPKTFYKKGRQPMWIWELLLSFVISTAATEAVLAIYSFLDVVLDVI